MSDWIVSFIARLGSGGVFVLMVLEHVFPPIPSELVMPLAGYHAQTGDLKLWLVIIVGSVGSLLGTSLWYLLGHRVGEHRLRNWIERHGKWLTLTTKDLDRSKEWFAHRGASAVFICRMIPALRTVISLPAGFSGMPISRFLLYSSAGTFLWTAALAYAGYWLGAAYEDVGKYLGPISWVVIGTALAIYVYRVVRQMRTQ